MGPLVFVERFLLENEDFLKGALPLDFKGESYEFQNQLVAVGMPKTEKRELITTKKVKEPKKAKELVPVGEPIGGVREPNDVVRKSNVSSREPKVSIREPKVSIREPKVAIREPKAKPLQSEKTMGQNR